MTTLSILDGLAVGEQFLFVAERRCSRRCGREVFDISPEVMHGVGMDRILEKFADGSVSIGDENDVICF